LNGLQQSILVSIEDLDIEFQQSKALKQIIPSGCMAGFDIHFSSKVVGKIKKSFTWKINGIHQFKVHVAAEVVPIELTMSKQELIMEFPPDLLKQTLSTDLVLTNPGVFFPLIHSIHIAESEFKLLYFCRKCFC
jgi:hypothetical protein